PGVAKDVANAWRILAENDEVFTYAKSESTDFAEIANGTGAIFAEPEPGSVGADVERAWRVYPLDDGGQPDKSKPAYVIHYKSGAVQLTIKNFTEGDAGSAAYAAVGNYAFNNGIVFEPDGFGLTQAAIERRLENLISLALKFGSTDFIRLSPNQLKAFKMKWRDGDTAFNTEQMLMASYNALAAKFPEIKDYTYDLNTGARKSDVGAMGRDEPGTEGIVARARAAGARAGERTVARAIFTNTFASEPTGKARRELVGSLGERSGRALGDNALAKSLYSRAEPSRTGVPMADAKAVIAAIREALPTAPPIQMHDSVRRAPENLRRLIRQAGADNDVEAVYHEGEIHVFPGN
ncbi:MAG TPA: hypothetical protein PLQ85_14240, partial [Anaerolineae bacterium]|nr:hypothetical protein [Anaerolineae bacterium]